MFSLPYSMFQLLMEVETLLLTPTTPQLRIWTATLYRRRRRRTTSLKSVWVEFFSKNHACRWRAEMWRFESVLEDIDSTFILKEEQRNAIKAFVDRKDVF